MFLLSVFFEDLFNAKILRFVKFGAQQKISIVNINGFFFTLFQRCFVCHMCPFYFFSYNFAIMWRHLSFFKFCWVLDCNNGGLSLTFERCDACVLFLKSFRVVVPKTSEMPTVESSKRLEYVGEHPGKTQPLHRTGTHKRKVAGTLRPWTVLDTKPLCQLLPMLAN